MRMVVSICENDYEFKTKSSEFPVNTGKCKIFEVNLAKKITASLKESVKQEEFHTHIEGISNVWVLAYWKKLTKHLPSPVCPFWNRKQTSNVMNFFILVHKALEVFLTKQSKLLLIGNHFKSKTIRTHENEISYMRIIFWKRLKLS